MGSSRHKVGRVGDAGAILNEAMSTADSIAASCDYCGRENPERLLACSGCGSPLSEEPPPATTGPKGKSMPIAITLALVFGPLGLLYSNTSAAIVLIVLAVGKMILLRDTGTTGALISFFAFRVVCVALAIHSISRFNAQSDPASDTEALLDQAARLESIDRAQAILAYEEIVKRFPKTAAGREAERNIQVLKQHT